MTELEYRYLCEFLKSRSGLALTPEKRYLVDSRLEPLCRRLDLGGIRDLVARLRAGGCPDLERAVVEAMTTNETFFFRDRSPFDLFRQVVLPRALAARSASKRLRIWCAAASTGQEPYSLAMILKEAEPLLAGWRTEIVATDLSTQILDRAKSGTYNQFEVQRGLPVQLLLKYFTQSGSDWQITPAIRAMVDFRAVNLIRDFGHLGTFDVVMCRNVLIYFDEAMKRDVLERIAAAMAPDGALLLGAAETVIGLTSALGPDPDHRGLYVRNGSARAAAAPLRLAASR